jgi:hypothetical protein
MEHLQPESVVDNKTVFTDISLEKITADFKRTYTRNRGTIGQLVYSLQDMINRLNTPKNDYQVSLYPKIQEECKGIVSEYNRLLTTIKRDDYYLIGYYLNGSRNNGKRKPTTAQYEKKSYGVSEYKETLKSINDRLRHIKYNCVYKARESEAPEQDIYKRMIVFCDEYHKVINACLEEWKLFITTLRSTQGVTKQVKGENQSNKQANHKIRVRRKYKSKNNNNEQDNINNKSLCNNTD